MTTKQIISLTKQNDGMFTSLSRRNIEFKRNIINETMNDDEKLLLLQEENARLKTIIQINKPPPEPKKEKVVQEPTIEKPKVIAYHTYTDLDTMKRAFFNNNFDVNLLAIRHFIKS